MEFKDYKEKQAYYKELAKQEKMLFISKGPTHPRLNLGSKKGRTYVKSKDGDK